MPIFRNYQNKKSRTYGTSEISDLLKSELLLWGRDRGVVQEEGQSPPCIPLGSDPRITPFFCPFSDPFLYLVLWLAKRNHVIVYISRGPSNSSLYCSLIPFLIPSFLANYSLVPVLVALLVSPLMYLKPLSQSQHQIQEGIDKKYMGHGSRRGMRMTFYQICHFW